MHLSRFRSIVIPALLVVCAAALYLPGLGATPDYAAIDEVFSGLTAHSLATTGRDLHGRLLPLYFEMPSPFRAGVWFQPVLMYAIALTVKVLPLSEGTIRLPMAIFAVVDVLLIYLVAKQLFQRESLAIGAAILLALAPEHFGYGRVAMDFQAPLPFILAWLLCLLIYRREGRASWLFGAGVSLGVGLYSYLASYMLMPIYALLTCGALYRRREPMRRYAVFAAGFILPAALSALFLLNNPAAARDMLWHYERDESHIAGAFQRSAGLVTLGRLGNAAFVYGSFWNPRVLFVSGRESMWGYGMLLLPVAGALAAGVLRVIRRPTTESLLIVAGLLTAPLPASFVAHPEAIHRVAAMVPFAVLLAMIGMEYVWTAEAKRGGRIAFVAMWATLIGLTLVYRGEVSRAQAVLRAATIPLTVAGLAVLLQRFTIDRIVFSQIAVAVAALTVIEIAYAVLDYWIIIGASAVLLASIAVAALVTTPNGGFRRRPSLAVVLLSVMASAVMYMYLDYRNIPRLWIVPAVLAPITVRLVSASIALAAMFLFIRHAAVDRLSRAGAALAVLVLVATQVAYFDIDRFAGVPRLVQAMVVLIGVVGVALVHRTTVIGHLRLGQIAAASLFALTATQFAYFSLNYSPSQRAQAHVEERAARRAFETAISRARDVDVPAVYLDKLGPFGAPYWKFYAIKHNRSDLLPRTRTDIEFTADRARDAAPGTIAIVGLQTGTDKTLAHMLDSGELHGDLVQTPDGTPLFWVLEKGGR